LPNSAAFFSDKNEIINDNYQLKNKELISIIPPIGGG
jgi:molybdopterin converting factor small subunit